VVSNELRPKQRASQSLSITLVRRCQNDGLGLGIPWAPRRHLPRVIVLRVLLPPKQPAQGPRRPEGVAVPRVPVEGRRGQAAAAARDPATP